MSISGGSAEMPRGVIIPEPEPKPAPVLRCPFYAGNLITNRCERDRCQMWDGSRQDCGLKYPVNNIEVVSRAKDAAQKTGAEFYPDKIVTPQKDMKLKREAVKNVKR